MSFHCVDLIIESIIRDGLANITKNPSIIDNIFASLNAPYNQRKYGMKEINKIKNLILENQIKVVHSFNQINSNVPCYSIQLGSDIEDKRLAHLEDFEQDVREVFTNPDDIANLNVLENVVAISYNSTNGKVLIDDAFDLSNVYPGLIFVDASGEEFVIKSGVSNTIGNKFIIIEKGLESVDLTDFIYIKSALNFKQYEINSVTGDVQIMLGVHTKDALTTKYLYILLKYFLLSRKKDLISRCFIVSTWNGSDFTRDFEYQGDIIYTRFLTVSGKVEDSWRGDEVELVDQIQVTTLVPKDEASAEDLEMVELTVKPADGDNCDC